MFAAIWTFLNSPLGESLVGELVGFLFHQLVPNDNRRAQVLGYANDAFKVVEALAAADPALRGIDKYNKFVEAIVNELKASGQPELSGPEMAMLQQLAQVKAMLAKPAPRAPLPLPPPPRG